tara:strand:- start:946 stop:1140 length:195 start_codon:yes stop_codon:yes gene_type:complete
MKKLEITFSLRDWKQGSELLLQLEMTEELELTDCHKLEVDSNLLDWLQYELDRSELEFDIEFKK